MGGLLGVGFVVLLVASVAVWLTREWRERHSQPLCPGCKRWHENTCSVPGRPDITRCNYFDPQETLGPIQVDESGKTRINWDWENES